MSVPRGPPAGGGAGGGSTAAAAVATRASVLPPDLDGVGGSRAASLPLPFCARCQHDLCQSWLRLHTTPMLLSLALSASGRRRRHTRVAANAFQLQRRRQESAQGQARILHTHFAASLCVLSRPNGVQSILASSFVTSARAAGGAPSGVWPAARLLHQRLHRLRGRPRSAASPPIAPRARAPPAGWTRSALPQPTRRAHQCRAGAAGAVPCHWHRTRQHSSDREGAARRRGRWSAGQGRALTQHDQRLAQALRRARGVPSGLQRMLG